MIEDYLWKSAGEHRKIPHFKCPSCKKGLLILRVGSLLEHQTAESKSKMNFIGGVEFYEGVFSAIVNCNNPNCDENVVVVGSTYCEFSKKEYDSIDDENEDLMYPDPHDTHPGYDFHTFYQFKFFFPPLDIIQIPKNCPKSVAKEIIASFSLFWNDTKSCANRIRSCLEKLLDEWKVKKQEVIYNKKEKRKILRKLTLNERIKTELPKHKKYKDFSDKLLAIKWIGNTGSHAEELTREVIISTYEILEFSLGKIFADREKEINRLSKRINQKKGKIKI